MLTLSSASLKLYTRKDCIPLSSLSLLSGESGAAQIYVTGKPYARIPVTVESSLDAAAYAVHRVKGDFLRPDDGYYERREDCMYPDLLTPAPMLSLNAVGQGTLYIEIPATAAVGEHTVTVRVGEESISFPVTVHKERLAENDLILTHWLYSDCICNYFGVPFASEEYYAHLRDFLASYTKQGNNTLLVPALTPPLDTLRGAERLTTQLVRVCLENGEYSFDFTDLDRYIALAREFGIQYFEFSHLFTQWGGACCPKVIVCEDGEEKKCFGWDTSATDDEYRRFLAAYLEELSAHLDALGIKESCFFHVTDEPRAQHIEHYSELSAFVKRHTGGATVMDAVSHYECLSGGMDLPVVSMNSADLDKFLPLARKLIYYCVEVDQDYYPNRYIDMPTQRSEVLGCMLYLTGAQGFLHWGYNFYNERYSRYPIDPYVSATAPTPEGHGGLPAGDCFLVYPTESGVNYTLRYFSVMRAYEDYRLLKTLEAKIGRAAVLDLLTAEGVTRVNAYPRSAEWQIDFRRRVREMILA